MLVAPTGYLSGLRKLCTEHDVLLIVDEVATGFGRTGTMFACEQEGVSPDLMCVAKGITGGYLPLAATMTTEEVFSAFLGGPADGKTFYHGHSYTGNPLGCAAALASLDIFEKDGTLEHVREVSAIAKCELERFERLTHVGEIRQKGLMVGIELYDDVAGRCPYPPAATMGARVCRRARTMGLITRPLGDVIVFLPPLVSTATQVVEMLAIIENAIQMETDA
jgi:adenosylmethionine-8-amino-7-oxononanoate aminotransferase